MSERQRTRRTALSERQLKFAWRDLQIMLKDTHVVAELQALVAFVDESPEMVLGECWWRAPGPFGERLRALVGYCNEYEFAFARLQGSYLEQWLAALAADKPSLAPEHTDRLYSEHPARLLASGKVELDRLSLTEQEKSDMQAYLDSLRPPERRGPKVGSHHTKKREPGPPEKQCQKVYDFRTKEELDWPEIYRQMHPGSSVSPADAFKWCKPRYDKALRLLALPPDDNL
jgi:hypothetical protein